MTDEVKAEYLAALAAFREARERLSLAKAALERANEAKRVGREAKYRAELHARNKAYAAQRKLQDEIWQRHQAGQTAQELARHYRMRTQQINRIIRFAAEYKQAIGELDA